MHLAPVVAAAFASSLCGQAAWSVQYHTVSPEPRERAPMACFERTGEIVLLQTSNGGAMQSWRLLGDTWSVFTPPQTQQGSGRGFVYDSFRERLVLFGGHVSGNVTDATWEWDGATWTMPNPVVRPPARGSAAVAFDRARGVTVVFGGVMSSGSFHSDVWEWDGSQWAQRASNTPLGPRAYSLAAFDPSHGNVLVYGGLSQTPAGLVVRNDTWSWDGATWTQHTPSVPPPYNVFGAMVTDLHRSRVILAGGISGMGLTHEWNGFQWNVSGPSLGERSHQSLAYDTSLRRTVMFGGASAGYLVPDTWVYRTPSPADVVSFGVGCAGTAGLPQLSNRPFSLPWVGDTVRHVVANVPANEPGAVFLSSFGTTLPAPLAAFGMPGCDLLVGLDFAEFRAAANGSAEWAAAIPNTPSLAGAVLRQQAFVLDAAANAAGLTNSNGIIVTLGVR